MPPPPTMPHRHAVDARDWQQECVEPVSYQGKNIHIQNTTPGRCCGAEHIRA